VSSLARRAAGALRACTPFVPLSAFLIRAPVIAVAALAIVGCHESTRITVAATWEDHRPIAELEIVALPFNPDRILDSLATEATTPPPTFPELLHEMRVYTIPEDDPYAELNRPWLALRDSVEALSDTLMAMDRSVPAYAAGYARFRTLYGRLADLAAARDRALRDVNGDRVALARRAAAAADSLRAWEYTAYAAYPEVAAEAVVASGREVVEGVTAKDGTVLLVLDPGRWWLVARTPDETNPFMEYYWNVPATTTRVIPIRLPLTPERAVRRWRH
jgi:hypothetical protein